MRKQDKTPTRYEIACIRKAELGLCGFLAGVLFGSRYGSEVY